MSMNKITVIVSCLAVWFGLNNVSMRHEIRYLKYDLFLSESTIEYHHWRGICEISKVKEGYCAEVAKGLRSWFKYSKENMPSGEKYKSSMND